MTDDFPVAVPARPLWLVTLADLALLLVGFLVLVDAGQRIDRHALARGFREGFGTAAPPPVRAPPAPMPVAAAAGPVFAAGAATMPDPPAGLIDWARAAARDPRVMLTVTGSVDGSAADVDASTGSGAILAADRARAVAAALVAAHAAAPGRLSIATAARPGPRTVFTTLAFAGETR